MAAAPLILVDPLPRTLDMICDEPTRLRLQGLGRLVIADRAPMPDEVVERHLPDAVAIIGQTDLPAERIERAPNLRAVINVEGNFLPNVDYAAARARGIHVLCAERRVRDAGRRGGARHGDRPRARDRRRRPRDARRARDVRARVERGRVPARRQPGRDRRLRRPRPRAAAPARAVRLPACACTTRGCRRWRSAARAPSRPRSTTCSRRRASCSCSPPRRATTRSSSASASCGGSPPAASWC